MKELALLPPTEDLNQLWHMGLAGAPLVQYLKWADDLGIFQLLATKGTMSVEQLVAGTSLTPRGAEALLGVLSSLQVTQRIHGKYLLSRLGEEYLVKGGCYYVAPSLYGMLKAGLPPRMRKGERVRFFSKRSARLWQSLLYYVSNRAMGRPERLAVQHSRNFPAAVVAVSKGLFADVRHLLDVGGGSGAFAIPLIRDRPDIRVTLMDLPRALPHIRKFLRSQRVLDRVELLGLNMHRGPWPQLPCDGVLFGNILHFCSHDEAVALLREAFRLLPAGGRIFIHEMLWNDNMDGPLTTALWNFWMTSVSAGKQRTWQELLLLLATAGFERCEVTDTWGSFSLITAIKAQRN